MSLSISKIKRVVILIAVIAAAVILTGCGASLTVRDYVENGIRYSLYELSIDNDTVALLETSAATKQDSSEKYTVAGYFLDLFELMGCELVDAKTTTKAYKVSFKKAHIGGTELSKVPEFKTAHNENPFVRTYTAVADDPFNGLRDEYDNAPDKSSTTLMEILKNGYIVRDEHGDTVSEFPAVTQAFPYAATVSPDGLKLNYVWTGSSRMSSSGTAKKIDKKTSEYTFTRYFDSAERKISFEYKRAVPYGWYLIALAAGGIVLGIILLVTRTKKEKPTLLDRFPYNPEEYRGYEKNLPANRR